MSVPPDRRLALRAELQALYGSHHGRIVRWFRHAGLDEARARELAQDSFVNALRGLHQFQGNSKLSTWLWTIAGNVLKAHWRATPEPSETSSVDEENNPIDPDSLSNGRTAHQTDCDECVRKGFAAFAAKYPDRAQVVFLAVVEGCSREELAEHLGRTPHAATQYLYECKARLKPFIQDCHEQ